LTFVAFLARLRGFFDVVAADAGCTEKIGEEGEEERRDMAGKQGQHLVVPSTFVTR
jgi:hypothetical protein